MVSNRSIQRTLITAVFLLSISWNGCAQKGRLYVHLSGNKTEHVYNEGDSQIDSNTTKGDSPDKRSEFYDKYISIYQSLSTGKVNQEITEKKNRLPIDSFSPLGPKAQALRNASYNALEFVTEKTSGLRIRINDEEFLYEEKQLWSVSDTKKMLSKTDLKLLDKQLNQTLKVLNKLEEESPYAQRIIRTLQHSENKFVISLLDITESYMLLPIPGDRLGVLNNNAYAFQAIEQGNLLVNYAPFDKIGSGAEIRWNPELGMISLAHELSHAYDANYGLMDDRLMHAYGEVMSAREIRALFHENMIRKELKMKLKYKVRTGGALILNDMPFTYPLPVSARY